jgi:pilus assembly protein TadC
MSAFKRYIERLQVLLYDAEVDVEPHRFVEKVLLEGFLLGVGAGALAYYFLDTVAASLVIIAALVGIPTLEILFLTMKANKRTAQIEEMLPNFLSMMASNIRSGVTYDRALLLSSRKEFGPLAREIDRAAKQTVAGKPLQEALMEMTRRTRSETFAKTMRLIVEGVNAGGNLAEMLEITAVDIRKSSSLKKEIAATVLVYRLFIVMAATVGAPLLYALTGFLIDVLIKIRGSTGFSSGAAQVSQMPMFSGGTVISPDLFFIYAITAIGLTTLLSTLASGVITKGKESEGLPDLGWSFLLAFGIFFGVKYVFGFVFGQIG